MRRIFILSPARTDGKRAELLLNDRAQFELARRLRENAGVPLGDVFSFLSGLYFRGKLAYASHFARPPAKLRGCYVITSNSGLLCADEPVTLSRLRLFAQVPIDLAESRYCEPLLKSAREIAQRLPARSMVVLLGSIATGKYVDLFLEAFGERLAFPRDFVGRGDMSRGGLMLRAVRADAELEYIRIADATQRRGKRPPKLEPLRTRASQRPTIGDATRTPRPTSG